MNRPYEMSFSDLLGILRRRRTFLFQVLAAALALGALVTLTTRPMYRASSSITADRTPPLILLDQTGQAPQDLGQPVGLASPDVATLVALANSQTVRDTAFARLAPVHGPRAAQAILGTLRVQSLRNTQLVAVSVDASDPVVAAEAANAVVASLTDMDLNARRRWAREMREFIEQQLAATDPTLRAAEDALAASKAEYGDVPLSEKTVTSLNRLAQLEAQRVDVRLQQQEGRARIAAARIRLAAQAEISPTRWQPSPLINALQTQLATEEIELSGLRRQFTPKHPMVLNVAGKIAETRQRLDSELARSLQADQYGVDPVYQQLIQQLRQDEVAGAALEARDKTLGAAIEQYAHMVRQLPAREVEQARLTREVTEAEAIHKALTDKLQQALVAEASIGSVIRVVDVAKPPIQPGRRRFLGLAMGAIFGFIVGVGGALVKEQIEDPIKSVEHGERVLGTPILGAIPQISPELAGRYGGAQGERAPGLWRSLRAGRWSAAGLLNAARRQRLVFAESFRRLRTNLLYLRKRPPRTLLVTSPGRDEGTEIVAANLAIALAQAGLRVWLVECDLRNPALSRVPALRGPERGAGAGIAEMLDTGISERQIIRRTALENLWFLPAGTPPPKPAELLGSQRMRAFLNQGREDIDVIVLAAPPVLPVTDTAVLAPGVEGVLLVVRIGTTSQDAAQRARHQLEMVGAQVLGTVLTGAPIDGPGSRFDRSGLYHGSEASQGWFFGHGQRESPEKRTGATASQISVPGAARLPLLLILATLLGIGAGIVRC